MSDITIKSNTIDPSGEITVTMTWHHQPQSLIRRVLMRDRVDLDLGCFYRLRDGRRGVIDALQFAYGQGGPRSKRSLQGCYNYIPYIWHQGDRAGNSGDISESIIINPQGLTKLQSVMLYAYIYDGEAAWGETRVELHIDIPGRDIPGRQPIDINVDQQPSDKKMCVMAQLDFSVDGDITIHTMLDFYNTHSECSAAYNWDLQFKPNNK